MCGVFVNDWVNSCWFLIYWGFILLWVMVEGFDNTCRVLGKWKFSRVIPRLYGWVYKTVRLALLAVEHSIAVISASSQPKLSANVCIYINKKYWPEHFFKCKIVSTKLFLLLVLISCMLFIFIIVYRDHYSSFSIPT